MLLPTSYQALPNRTAMNQGNQEVVLTYAPKYSNTFHPLSSSPTLALSYFPGPRPRRTLEDPFHPRLDFCLLSVPEIDFDAEELCLVQFEQIADSTQDSGNRSIGMA